MYNQCSTLGRVLLIICTGFPFSLRAEPQDPSGVTQLEQIVVEGQGVPEADLPMGTSISGETLKTTPGAAGDPLRGLQALPGMVFTDDESAEPAVRGSRPEDNYLEADFVPIGYLFHADGVISVFNSDLIESFNIYSSAYGPEFSGVTGGVFDVRLRDPRSDRFHTSLDVSFLQAGLLVEGPVTDNQSFYLAGRFSYLDLLVEGQLEEEDGIEFTQFPKYTDYQGKYVWALNDNSTLRFQANGAKDDFDVNVAEDSEEIDLEPIFAGRSFESTSFNEQSVLWDFHTDGDSTVKSVLSHTTFSSKAQAGGAGEFDEQQDLWLLKSYMTLPLSERHDLSFGASLSHLKADIDIAFNAPACTEFEPECNFTSADRLETRESLSINSTHLFVKDNWYANDRLTLFPGIALQAEDYLEKQFVEPRFALEYAVRDDLIVSAGLGLYHQIPQFDQIDQVFGNPELDYIESTQGLVGVQKKFTGGWDVKSELYYKQLDNLVSGDEDQRYNNDGEGYAYGLDTLIRKDVSSKLSGWLAVSLSKARRENPITGASFPFEYDQPVNVSLVGNYQLNSRWTLGAKLWVHSGAPYTPITGATPDDEIDGLYNPQYGEINSKRFPLYHRLDFRVERDFSRAGNGKTSGYLEILNVLNSENISYYDYNQDYSEREEVYQLPTILSLGFKTEW